MANKAVDVEERRLRTVYDCIDSSNNKKAMQEADKVLKKHPNLLTAKALKCLGLIRLGRTDEGDCLLKELNNEDIGEERTLQVLSYCFRETNQPSRMLALYERACQLNAGNEELMVGLFMCLVRDKQLKKQQMQAMQLFKAFKKTHYYFWAVMSVYMQALTDSKMSSTVHLPLAEKMVKKAIDMNMIEARAEVDLYWMILMAEHKYEDALNLLHSDIVAKLGLSERMHRELDLLTMLHNWSQLYNVCIKWLPIDVDDWLMYMKLLEATFALIAQNPDLKTEYIQETSDLIIRIADTKCDRPCRGPHLARLKLIQGLLERDLVVREDLGTSNLVRFVGEPLILLTDFFVRFGDRQSCFNDINPFLCLLGENQQAEFLRHLFDCCGLPGLEERKSCGFEISSFANNPKQLQKHVCCLQLHRVLDRHKSVSLHQKMKFAAELVHRFKDALRLDDGDPCEYRVADPYLMLALNYIWDVYAELADSSLLGILVVVCLLGWHNSACVDFKLVLSKLYALLGASNNVVRICDAVDIKGCLLETSGFFALDQLTQWGLFSQALSLFDSTNAFFTTGLSEIQDSYKACYQHGAFNQIPEIMRLEDKLADSLYRVASSVSRVYVKVLTECTSVDSVVCTLREESPNYIDPSGSVDWTTLIDNRCFDALPSWQSIEQLIQQEKLIKTSFQEMLDFIRFRQLLLHCLSLLSCAFTPSSNDAASKSSSVKVELEVLRTVIGQLKAHYKHCRDMYADPSTAVLQGPLPIHFNIYLQGSYFEAVSSLFDSAYLIFKSIAPQDSAESKKETTNEREVNCSNGHSNENNGVVNEMSDLNLKCDDKEEQSLSTLEHMQALFRRMFSNHLLGVSGAASPLDERDEGGLGGCNVRFPHWQLCHCSYLAQSISLCLIVCQLCWHRVNSQLNLTASSSKKAKKRQSVSVEGEGAAVVNQLRDVCRVVCNSPSTLSRLIEDLDMILNTPHSVNINMKGQNAALFDTKDFEFLESFKDEANNDLCGSYQTSIKEMKDICAHLESGSQKLMACFK